MALACTGLGVVMYRRSAGKKSLEKKYRPAATSAVDEEMSMSNIYSPAGKTLGEDGEEFALDLQGLRLLMSGEDNRAEEKDSPTVAETKEDLRLALATETVYDLTTMDSAATADLTFGSATAAAIVSFFDSSSRRPKKKEPAEEVDVSLDSVYPENKPIAFTQFSSRGKGLKEDAHSIMNFHDVYPDRATSSDLEGSLLHTPLGASHTPHNRLLSSTKGTSKKASNSSPPLSWKSVANKSGSSGSSGDKEKVQVAGFNPMRGKLRHVAKDSPGSEKANLLHTFQGEFVRKGPPVSTSNSSAYRDSIVESRRQLRRLDAAAGNNPLSYTANRSNALMRANANRFVDPVLSASSGGGGVRGRSTSHSNVGYELPQRHEVPIVEIFKSVNVAQMSGLSQGIKFRLSKLKFEARSGDR